MAVVSVEAGAATYKKDMKSIFNGAIPGFGGENGLRGEVYRLNWAQQIANELDCL